jgi:hypothetical protein
MGMSRTVENSFLLELILVACFVEQLVMIVAHRRSSKVLIIFFGKTLITI